MYAYYCEAFEKTLKWGNRTKPEKCSQKIRGNWEKEENCSFSVKITAFCPIFVTNNENFYVICQFSLKNPANIAKSCQIFYFWTHKGSFYAKFKSYLPYFTAFPLISM